MAQTKPRVIDPDALIVGASVSQRRDSLRQVCADAIFALVLCPDSDNATHCYVSSCDDDSDVSNDIGCGDSVRDPIVRTWSSARYLHIGRAGSAHNSEGGRCQGFVVIECDVPWARFVH